MPTYDSCSSYINSAATTKQKIKKIDNVITALEDAALKFAERAGVSEISMDSGQTVVRTSYRSVAEIAEAIKAFMTIRGMYASKLTGRRILLVDRKNFR